MHRVHLLLVWFLVAGWGMAQAPPSDPLEVNYNAAMQAFNEGKWNEAAVGLEGIVGAVTDPTGVAKLAPLVYTLGAAHFNAGNYAKAIEAFKLYLSRYPQSDRAAEVRLAAARAMCLNKDDDGSAKLFAQFEAIPAMLDEALAAQAECYRILGRGDDQIKILEKLVLPEIKSRAQAAGALTLAEGYLQKKQTDKALGTLQALASRIQLVDNVITVNSLIVQLGDELAGKKSYAEALTAYRRVRTREEVIDFQKERIAATDRKIKELAAQPTGNPQVGGSKQEVEASQAEAKKLLAEFEKLPDYWPAVLFRMGSAYYESGQKWEALVVFDRLLVEHPDGPDGERALYASLICSSELFRVGRTLRLCQEYLRKYPQGPNAETVGYLSGVMALQSNDADGAVSYFRGTLEKQPESKFGEEMRFLLGNAYFGKGAFAEARENYRLYAKDYPKGIFAEEVAYRDALSLIYEGKYEEAFAAFGLYLKQYPDGAFAADAGYRSMLCKYAADRFQEIVADVAIWEKKYPNDSIRGEVLSLLGDALAGLDKPVEAAAAYTRAYRAASSDDVLSYALLEAGAQWRKQGNWFEVSRLFESFVKERPDHPSVVTAMYWIGKSKAREGKAEEAKTFLVEKLKAHLDDPRREAVEQLLQQLAQLCVKRPQPSASGSPYDALEELRKQLAPLKASAKATGQARLLYAEAELFPLIKRAGEVPNVWKEIEIRFAPADLSPALLAGVGDYLLGKGDREAAGKVYAVLRDAYPKSSYLDSAYVGLGEIALAGGDAKQALRLFTYAVDEIAGAKLKEAMSGQARTQYELGMYEDSKKGFQAIAGFREWRGEVTAMAVFYLGEIEAKQSHWPEAVAHYQRVFVAYQKYLPWTAKAYVRCAEAFDHLGKRPEAIAHLREMLRNEKLKDFAETKQAAKLLSSWGAS